MFKKKKQEQKHKYFLVPRFPGHRSPSAHNGVITVNFGFTKKKGTTGDFLTKKLQEATSSKLFLAIERSEKSNTQAASKQKEQHVATCIFILTEKNG